MEISCIDHVRSEEVCITNSQGVEEYPMNNKKKEGKMDWSHIPQNYLLNHGTERKIEGRTEITGIRGKRYKNLMDDLKEDRGYWKLEGKALYRTLWRTRFGRGYGPVMGQTRE
jgi:hypothetical protein